MRRRVVCGLSETIATLPPQSALTSVDLPTFGRPATETMPDLILGQIPRLGQQIVGGVGRDRAVGAAEVDASKRHSCSHWRQPPHGDAVIAIASTSPGRRPSLAAFAIAERSAQIPSGYAAFSTFAAGEDAAVAREDGGSDEVVRVRRVRVRRYRVGLCEQLLGGHASAPPP